MDQLIIKKCSVNESRIELIFSVPENLQKYFKTNKFEIEYSENISNTPESIAVIPLLCQLLPISWILDFEIVVNEIDSEFINCIKNIKKGYESMYPKFDFKGKLNASATVNNTLDIAEERSAAFFSGGLDAYATLVAHADEHPLLLTVQGADITTDNDKGFKEVKTQNEATKEAFKTDLTYIKSNFREFLNEQELNVIALRAGESWWHGFQHGIGLIGLSAPLSFKHRLTKIYIASSFTPNDHVTCASHPDIDNNVRFCNTSIIHDQYEYNRYEKTRRVCDYVESNSIKVFLRVCWRIENGKNCCKCEKCLRTAAAIAVLGHNPDDYGFNKRNLFRFSRLKVARQISSASVSHWIHMRDKMIENRQKAPKGLKWIMKANLYKDRTTLFIRGINYICRHYPIFDKILGKL